MDKLVEGLAPAFAAGLAVQQLLEILGPLLDKTKLNKKIVLELISLVMGLGLAFGTGLRVLQVFGIASTDFWDLIVTGLIISGGTESFNSILKYMGYSKENAKKQLVSSEEANPEKDAQAEAPAMAEAPVLGADRVPG